MKCKHISYKAVWNIAPAFLKAHPSGLIIKMADATQSKDHPSHSNPQHDKRWVERRANLLAWPPSAPAADPTMQQAEKNGSKAAKAPPPPWHPKKILLFAIN